MAIAISAAMVFVYFGFILLIAFRKTQVGTLVHPGLSIGILLGALVILLTWVFTWIYVAWANRYVDAVAIRLKARRS